MLWHDILVALIGATGLRIGQLIDHESKTWRCPRCERGRKFSITTVNKEARESIKQDHMRNHHS